MAGCFQVATAGQYGLMFAYGLDDTAAPVIPGFVEGEEIRFRVNGVEAQASERMTWQNDRAPHQVDLTVEAEDIFKSYLPSISGSDEPQTESVAEPEEEEVPVLDDGTTKRNDNAGTSDASSGQTIYLPQIGR